MKKNIVSVTFIIGLLLVCLSGCGKCEHEWSSATCTKAMECVHCGEKEGEPLGHDYNDADCYNPKQCKVCNETEGEPLGHDYHDADCYNPKQCKVCYKTEGKPLGHNYMSGSCIKCNAEDPNYTNLNEMGFTKNYNMTIWLDIRGYNLGEKNYVYTTTSSIEFLIIYNNRFQIGTISMEDLKNLSKVKSTDLKIIDSEPLNIYNNDMIATSGESFSIIDRIVRSDRIIIKTYHDSIFSQHESWYAPADLLDFSTIREGEDDGVHYYYIDFKD